MLGGILALLSAAMFALDNASARRGVLTGSVAQALAITIPLGVPIFLVATVVFGALGTLAGFSAKALFLFSFAGVVHFVWGRYCNYRAHKAMGANLVAPVQQSNLIVTLALAVLFLGEWLTPLRLIGIALVVLGPALTYEKKKKDDNAHAAPADAATIAGVEGVKPVFRPHYAEGYFFALLSSTGYGLSPILVRLGVEGGGLGAGISAGFVSYLAATVAFALVMLWPGQARHVLSINRESAKWFTVSGVCVCFAQMLRYMALAIAPVSVVTPIQRLSLIFRLYFSKVLNPDHEVFGGRVIAATVVSLIGALVLSLSTELIQSLVPLPDSVVALLNWHWP